MHSVMKLELLVCICTES